MVNSGFTGHDVVTPQAVAERRVIRSYAPADGRSGLAALFALDDTLAGILRSTREPMIGQMRLTWWHDALAALDDAPPPAEPVLAALAASVVPKVPGGVLAALVEGWEALLDAAPIDDAALSLFAEHRGERWFDAAGRVLGATPNDPLAAGGRGWALADLAAHSRDPAVSRRASALAARYLEEGCRARWSRAARPLGAMVHLARLHDASPARRVGRALLNRMTGF